MSPQDMGKVAVLYGGWSAEREVSLQSGKAAHAALCARGVDAHLVDATPEGVLSLASQGFERVFIALHGRGGEDGQVQAALELQQLPYTGSHPLASGLCMDKVLTKRIWQTEELPSPKFVNLSSGFDPDAVVAKLGLPIFVKPGREGSSIGMSRVETGADLSGAYARAAKHDDRVMAEAFIAGAEYTASILAGQALPLVRIEAAADFYDYHAKYQSDETAYHCPCGLHPEEEQALQKLALKAFGLVGASGWGRVDFLLDAQDQAWLLEVNTVPGLTTHSLVPMAAAAAGMDFEELIWRILLTSLEVSA